MRAYFQPSDFIPAELNVEARGIGQMHAAKARKVALFDRPFPKPALLLSGGETTVTFDKRRPDAAGETPNSYCRSQSTFRCQRHHALATDTDGIDGSEQNAGA